MREMCVHVCGKGEEKRGYTIGEGGKKRGTLMVFCPIETRACWRYMYMMYVEGKKGRGVDIVY